MENSNPVIFSIASWGNLGNRILEFFAAAAIASKINSKVLINVNLPEWNYVYDKNLHESMKNYKDEVLYLSDSDVVDVNSIAMKINATGKKYVIFEGYFQRINLYCKPEYYRNLFPIDSSYQSEFADDEIVLNIRAGEILNGVSWYPLVPPIFYKNLVDDTNMKPVLLGQLDRNRYVDEIVDLLPSARLLPSQGAASDFNRLRQAKNICVAVSTFSWTSAWLSNADQIHVPLLGFLHPHCFKPGMHGLGGIDLAPTHDPRYHFHLMPLIHGEAMDFYLNHVSNLNPISKKISHAYVDQLKRQQPILNRQILELPIDEEWYIKQYPTAAWEISEGWYHDASHHYAEVGVLRNYNWHKDIYLPSSPNISEGKSANQSSISAWSIGETTHEDAMRALDGDTNKECAFHTDVEDFPWWVVNLDGLHNIECVNIFNRVNIAAIRTRINPLVLEFSLDGIAWSEIFRTHENFDFGAAVRPNIPLQWVRSESEALAKFVRIRVLKSKTYFHLSAVEIFGDPVIT